MLGKIVYISNNSAHVALFKGVNISKLQLNRNNLAEIWKKYWNTYKGKGTTNQFKRRWKELNIDKIKQQHIINNFRNENGKTNKKEK